VKDYRRWHEEKVRINNAQGTALFHEREIWWCSLGENVGCEQDGGKDFVRPVVIIKKFNLDACLVVPLTGRPKQSRYYFGIGKVDNRDAVAVLSQVRFIDGKLLTNKVGILGEETFNPLIRAVIRVSFSL